MPKIKILRKDGVVQRYKVKKKNLESYFVFRRGIYIKVPKPSKVEREIERRNKILEPKYYRTLLSLAYYTKKVKREKFTPIGRICQYYVSVVSDVKDKYSMYQMEEIEKHLSLLLSMSSRRSDIRWQDSVYNMPSIPQYEILAFEDNIPIEFDEIGGKQINYVYRDAIFFKGAETTEYGEETIKKTEKRLNESGDLDTYLDNKEGRIKTYRGIITGTVKL